MYYALYGNMRFSKAIRWLLFLSASIFAHAEEGNVSWVWNNAPIEQVLDFYQTLSGEVIIVPNGWLGKVSTQRVTFRSEHPLSRAAAQKNIEDELKNQASLTLGHFDLAEALEMNRQPRRQTLCVMSIRVPTPAANEVATNAIQLPHGTLPKAKEVYESLLGTEVVCQSEKGDLLASGRFISLNTGPQTKETARQLLVVALGVQADIQVGPVKKDQTIWRDKWEALRKKESQPDFK